jgi:hypothetical protein
VRVWCDLDGAGVGIARLVLTWAPRSGRPHRMGPEDVVSAPTRRRLDPRRAAEIRRDLKREPDAPLTATLRALVEGSCWIEQEAFLVRSSPPLAAQ